MVFKTSFYQIFFSKISCKIPKIILASLWLGGSCYNIANNVRLNQIKIPGMKSIIYAAAATSRLDRIKSFNFIADVVKNVTPSIVSITVSNRFPETDFGSGFIVDESGYILTNAHIVSKSSFVTVTLTDGQKYHGDIIAVDKMSDLALIKINPGTVKLMALKFAEISNVRTGEFVIALGSPISFSNSVAVGVVSAVQREFEHLKGLQYVQTDAVINVGNSGGPLINVNGDVVGVNTMRVCKGFGCAISSNHCYHFVNMALNNALDKGTMFMEFEKQATMIVDGFKKKCIGVVIGSFTPQMAKESKANNPDYLVLPNNGVFIHSVLDNTPAHKYGILAGDVIESVNGVIMCSTAEFTNMVSQFYQFDIVLIRNGERFMLRNITLDPY